MTKGSKLITILVNVLLVTMLLLLILLRDTDNLYHVIPANGTSSICQFYLVFVLAFILGMESAGFFFCFLSDVYELAGLCL